MSNLPKVLDISVAFDMLNINAMKFFLERIVDYMVSIHRKRICPM